MRVRTILVITLCVLVGYTVVLWTLMHRAISVSHDGDKVGTMSPIVSAQTPLLSLPSSRVSVPTMTATATPNTVLASSPQLSTTTKHRRRGGGSSRPTLPRNADSSLVGYTVSETDNRAHAHPGGTEEEANQDRLRLEAGNLDAVRSNEFWKISAWRVAERRVVPDALLASQEHLLDDDDDDDDAEHGVGGDEGAAASPFADLTTLSTAVMKDCGGDLELNDFYCLIRSYERQIVGADSSASCRNVYGAGLIERLRRHNYDMCAGGEGKIAYGSSSFSSSPSSSSTTLHCFSDRIAPDHTVNTAVCGGRNLRVDYSKMLDGDFPWLSFQPGALEVGRECVDVAVHGRQQQQQQQPQWQFMHCLRDWMELGLRQGKFGSGDDVSVSRGGGDDDSPLSFFVTRSGDYSPFALAHDWVNTVIAFAVANISRTRVQLHMMDRMTVGFFTPMWNLAFSPRRPIKWFPDLRRHHKQQQQQQKYKRAFFNIPARLSPLYNSDNCGVSPILRFTSDLLVSRVGAHAVRSPTSHFVIVLIVRRNYATGHSIERRIPNWRALASALRTDKQLAAAIPNSVVLHALDYADFDFDQQLNISRSADLIVGMHGAGLIQAIFLPPHGGIFEIFCPDRPPGNNRYENLARRLGIQYGSFYTEDATNAVPVPQVVSGIARLAQKVARNKKKTRRNRRSNVESH